VEVARTPAVLAGAGLALGGGVAQVALAQAYASAGVAAVPVAVAGGLLALGASLLLGGSSEGPGAAWGWLLAGAVLCVACGAWALLPAAWYSAGLGWLRRGGSETALPHFLGWYLGGFAVGVGWWTAFVTLR
jgi:hypothetical protein